MCYMKSTNTLRWKTLSLRDSFQVYHYKAYILSSACSRIVISMQDACTKTKNTRALLKFIVAFVTKANGPPDMH